MTNVVAYIRVSTKSQGDSGLGLEAQRDYIQRAAQASGWNVIGEFVDVVSGKLALEDRPEGAKALAMCKQHNAQLLVAKLDRLSRSVLHIAQLMEQVDFKVATMPQANTFHPSVRCTRPAGTRVHRHPYQGSSGIAPEACRCW